MCDCVDLANAGNLAFSAKNLNDYKRSLRGHVRRYWSGAIDKKSFRFAVFEAVDRAFNRAFNAGIANCGKKRSDLSADDLDQLQKRINDQFPFTASLADSIETQSDGGKLNDQFAKLNGWFSRYGEIVELGKVIACGDENLVWVLGVAEHCSSCKKLSGIVKPASFWNESGILPRVAGASYLECSGYNCQCSLQRTNKPITSGKLPSLP